MLFDKLRQIEERSHEIARVLSDPAIFGQPAEYARLRKEYAEAQRWKVEVMDSSPTGVGGLKDVILFSQGRGAWSRLKFERGVHRVQRVPVTEASGRIHTSTVTVAVLPEAEDVDVRVEEKD